MGKHFLTPQPNAAKETLIPLSESLLVEYLDHYCRRAANSAMYMNSKKTGEGVDLNRKEDSHVEILIPGWRDGTLDCVCGIRLISINRNHSKWVWMTEDLALHEGIGGQNWR